MQRMFARILQCQMAPVHGLSAEGMDLLRRLLDPNPDSRLSVQQALQHPWVAVDVPPGLQVGASNIAAAVLVLPSLEGHGLQWPFDVAMPHRCSSHARYASDASKARCSSTQYGRCHICGLSVICLCHPLLSLFL